jgi:pyridoxal biosynthesis lyase PdxS
MSKPKLSYIVINISQLDNVDFSEVIEQYDTVRKSLDKSEFIVKWVEGSPTIPASIEAIPESDRGNILTHSEAVELMKSAAWSEPIE